jgi:anti-anti-sigma factor
MSAYQRISRRINTMDKFETFNTKDMIIAAPEGEMVSRSYPEIENAIVGGLDGFEKMKVVFNMEKVGFIDSAGIIFLLRLKSMVASRGGSMVVYNLKQNIEKTLVKLRLDTVLNLSKDAEQCFIDLWYLTEEEKQSPVSAFKQ